MELRCTLTCPSVCFASFTAIDMSLEFHLSLMLIPSTSDSNLDPTTEE